MEKIERELEEIALKEKRLEAKKRLIKLKARKSRTRRLIEIGGIFEKANLDLNNNELLGLFCKAREKVDTHRNEWADIGAREFERDKKEKGEPVVISFDSEPSKETKDLIKEAGLKWNRYRKEWNGFANKTHLEKLLEKANAKIEVLGK